VERGSALPDCATDLAAEIAALESSDMSSLRLRWRATFRKAFPENLPTSLVVGILACRLQADVLGDLGEAEKKYLEGIARKPGGPKVIHRFGEREGRHRPGTVFVREHGGEIHRVVSTETGFAWQGRNYASLSAVACAITGTNWNGLRFFGVKPASGAARDR
jgi:hypothetical protein